MLLPPICFLHLLADFCAHENATKGSQQISEKNLKINFSDFLLVLKSNLNFYYRIFYEWNSSLIWFVGFEPISWQNPFYWQILSARKCIKSKDTLLFTFLYYWFFIEYLKQICDKKMSWNSRCARRCCWSNKLLCWRKLQQRKKSGSTLYCSARLWIFPREKRNS